MSISIDKLIHHSNNTIQPMKNSKKEAAPISGKKFDEVLISSSASQIQEKKITETLEGKVMSQIQSHRSEEDIQRLKQSVTNGEYRISPEDIASRILLGGGAYRYE